MTKKGRKKLWIIIGVLVIVIVVFTFSLNIILGGILRHTIDNQLEATSNKSNKELKVGKVKFNLLARTLTLKNISIVPDSGQFEMLKQGKLDQVSVMKIKIPVLKLHGMGIIRMLMERHFTLKRILFKGVEFIVYKNEFVVNNEKEENADPPISLDSIRIAGVNGISLSKIVFEKFSYTTVDVKTNDTIFSFKVSGFEIKGLELDKTNESGKYFRFDTKKLALKMRRQRIDLTNANYFIFLRKLDFSISDKHITASDFMVKPTRDKFKMGASYKYTKEVFDVEVKSINVFGYKIDKALRQSIIDIDSILVDGLKFEIYKDKNRPFDESKRPLFLQQQLKTLKQPLHIKKVKVNNSNFNFLLRPEDSKKLMHVDISNIEADINFITSISDSLQSGKELEMNIKGVLMGASPLNLNIIMPYNSPVDTFYFSGNLGSGDFTKFNPALFPVTGIKFDGGQLNSMKFYAHASPKSSKGLMTMLYDDLKAEIPKKDAKKKNKFLSFSANAVIRTQNPSKNGKTRVALVKTDRVLYKGFGNLLWKTVQSGLVNTLLPTGKIQKEEKELKRQEKKATKEKSKKKWWKKK